MQPVSAFCHSAKALCVCLSKLSVRESYLVLSVLPLYKLHIRSILYFCIQKKRESSMSNRYLVDWSKKEDESSSRFRSSVPPCVGTRGDRNWIWWREWRQASPYFFPTHQMRQPLPGIGSPLGFLPWGLARRFVFHPPRRVSARAPRLSPLCHPSMRSCWRWWLVLWPN